MKYKLLMTIIWLTCFTMSFCQTKSEKIIASKKPVIQQRMNDLGIKDVNSIYIRVFKYESQMELWLNSNDGWYLYKTYDVCGRSGLLGRKMISNDRQIPEGAYHITQLNVNSQYHLSLKINYPNKADYFYSDSTKPGDEIFIHGGCASIGCISILDEPMEEVWTLVHMSKIRQIPVHIFSIRFNDYRSERILKTFAYVKQDLDFQDQMKKIYYYWEWNKRLPEITIDKKGNYVIQESDNITIKKWSEGK